MRYNRWKTTKTTPTMMTHTIKKKPATSVTETIILAINIKEF